MTEIMTIIGARPQIIKAAGLSRAIRNHFHDSIKETIVHTGQHYDDNMSKIFFDEMEIPEPDVNLNVGSDSHGRQTASMIEKIEELLMSRRPDWVVLYGDTNSTLAGALAAVKLHVPVVHIEAGLRSFNKSMPEEINRIVCDHSSTLLFTPTRTGLNNLIHEGFKIHSGPPFTVDNPGVFHCGDIMLDNSLYFAEKAREKSKVMEQLTLTPGEFILATIHRDHNTDNAERLHNIFDALMQTIRQYDIDIVLPLHPRTNKMLNKNLDSRMLNDVRAEARLKIVPPASFFDMIALEQNCRMVMTDSGGVQKEAYFFKKPVIILRPQTEWVEIAEQGCGRIADADPEAILAAVKHFSEGELPAFAPIFGDGKAAEFICRKLINHG
ncbi:MAG: UDP-N-acetylglucosamine 2-epimerase (non-hydrolyzing) [Bacteroidales bacterium]